MHYENSTNLLHLLQKCRSLTTFHAFLCCNSLSPHNWYCQLNWQQVLFSKLWLFFPPHPKKTRNIIPFLRSWCKSSKPECYCLHMFKCFCGLHRSPRLKHATAVWTPKDATNTVISTWKDSLYICFVSEIHNIIYQSVDVQCLRMYSNITCCFVCQKSSLTRAKVDHQYITWYIFTGSTFMLN